MTGGKADGARRLLPLVRGGNYAGVSVGYRRSDEAKWPAPLHDCKAAIRWIRANAARYRLDPARIGVWGLGRGGHLAFMLGVTGDIPDLKGTLGRHTRVSSQVQAVADFFGVPDPSDKATAETHATRGDPPVLTVHGTADPIVPYDQAVRLDAALKAAGVPTHFVTVYRSGHGDFGTLADRRVEAFFDKYLRDSPYNIPTNGLARTPDPELLPVLRDLCLRGNCKGRRRPRQLGGCPAGREGERCPAGLQGHGVLAPGKSATTICRAPASCPSRPVPANPTSGTARTTRRSSGCARAWSRRKATLAAG